MRKQIFYSSVEKITWVFSLADILHVICSAHGIKDGTVTIDVIDGEGTVEVTQKFETPLPKKESL